MVWYDLLLYGILTPDDEKQHAACCVTSSDGGNFNFHDDESSGSPRGYDIYEGGTGKPVPVLDRGTHPYDCEA